MKNLTKKLQIRYNRLFRSSETPTLKTNICISCKHLSRCENQTHTSTPPRSRRYIMQQKKPTLIITASEKTLYRLGKERHLLSFYRNTKWGKNSTLPNK